MASTDGNTSTRRRGFQLYAWVGPALALTITVLCFAEVVSLRRGHSFPFVELKSFRDSAGFNAPPAVEPRAREPLDAVALTHEIRSRFTHGEAPMLDAPPLRDGEDPLVGVCSEYAKAAQAFAAQDGHVMRTVWLSAHTVNEYWEPESQRWIVVDVSGNQQWQDASGDFLGVTDLILGETEAFHVPILPPELLEAEPGLAQGLLFGQEALEYYRDTKVCVVVEDGRLFEFHRRNRDPAVLAGYLLAGEPVARGIQFLPPQADGPHAGSLIGELRMLALAMGVAWIAGGGWWLGALRLRRKRPLPGNA